MNNVFMVGLIEKSPLVLKIKNQFHSDVSDANVTPGVNGWTAGNLRHRFVPDTGNLE